MANGNDARGDNRHPGLVFEPPNMTALGDYAAVAPTGGPPPVGPMWVADSSVLEVKAAIEAFLSAQSTSGARTIRPTFDGPTNIQGVGLGCAGLADTLTAAPGTPVLTVFVGKAATIDEVRDLLVTSLGVRSAVVREVALSVAVTGYIEPLSTELALRPASIEATSTRMRPAPGGSSVDIDSAVIGRGTFGCLSYGRSPPRDARTLMLSCNHVIAGSNSGQIGACIMQPGSQDGGVCSRDQIGVLERFIPINFSGVNYVDCATAWCWPDRVRRELFYPTATGDAFFRMSNTPVQATCNGPVGKCGVATGMTLGYVRCAVSSFNAWYGDRSVKFENQICIQSSDSRPFAAPGDSGSVVWTWDSATSPIGLLFSAGRTSGGVHIAFANPMSYVLYYLDVNLLT